MKKFIILFTTLFFLFCSFLYGNKIKEISLQDMFKLYGMNVSIQTELNTIIIRDKNMLYDMEIFYEIGYMLEVLDDYYSQHNINLAKSNIDNLIFYYQENDKDEWLILEFSKENLIKYSNSNTLGRAQILQESF